MHSPSKMLLRLDFETQGYHAQADEDWRALGAGEIHRDDYIGQLGRVYGFEAPIEGSLAYTPELPTALDRRQRARSGLIAMDLLTLGIGPAQVTRLPQCDAIPWFRGAAEALGWLYVTQRSTLLHDRVVRNLRTRRPDLSVATAYLCATSGVAAARWQELGMLLDRVASTRKIEQQIVEAAHEAFTQQRSWFHAEEITLTG